ncbi:MAG: hypothetical protein B7733_05560 [Myxococcales bacterium FL481]|nr:MAG: hypothetical protein B7733_05560 [Myxococcales bacterium FL481]
MIDVDWGPLLVGFVVGAATAVGYLLLLRRAVRRVLSDRKAAAFLLGAAVRTLMPVAVLVTLAAWNRTALLSGATGFLLLQLIGRRRFAADPLTPPEPS